MSNDQTWKITPTVTSERVNLFSMNRDEQHHLATIISGSRRNLDRFDKSVLLIQAAPQMQALLEEVAAMLGDFGFLQSPSAQILAKKVNALLASLGGDQVKESSN